ncbi:MAG: hypothetical protein ACE5GE_02560 [Phycisphaerae bacterium]
MKTTEQNVESAGGSARRVLDLLRRQRGLYRNLRRLADRQRHLIHEGDSSPLLSLLCDRQKLTESLLQVGRELAPHRERWSQTRGQLDPGYRLEAEEIIAEVNGLLGEIIKLDEEDARLLSSRRTQTAGMLRTHRNTQRAVSAYAATAGGSGPDRIDQSS